MAVVKAIALAGLFVGLASACGKDLAAPRTDRVGTHSQAVDDCGLQSDNEIQICQGTGSSGASQFFGPRDDGIHPAPNDPDALADGIWLGDTISPSACFAEYNVGNSSYVDSDKDWLSNRCENALAYAFAPVLVFGGDQCPGGEPYWAAKYFPSEQVVRIAYLPAYYLDCGSDGHAGDSEFMSVEVGYNNATHHWEWRRAWLSAHYGSPIGDESGWDYTYTTITASQSIMPAAVFPYKNLTRMNVWISENKHANYPTQQSCNDAEVIFVSQGSCNFVAAIRFPTLPSHNLGSLFVPMPCVASADPLLANDGRVECFFNPPPYPYCFQGWNTTVVGGCTTPYITYLNSDKFEVFNSNNGADHGPGPTPPQFTITVSGPTAPTSGTDATYSATPGQGYPPYTVNWYVDGVAEGSGSAFDWTAGNIGTVYHITATASDTHGNHVTGEVDVVPTDPGGGLQPGGGGFVRAIPKP